MRQAMDRAPQTRPGRSRIGLCLALLLCSADAGCSRLKSSRRDPGPPMLGRERESTDVYARTPTTRTGDSSTSAPALAAGAVESPDPSGEARAPAGPRPKLVSSTTDRASADEPANPARVVAEARAALDGMQTYQVALHRQERVNGALLPGEDVVLAVRRRPLAVRLTWPSGPHQGREVLYRADEPGGLMHVNPGSPLPRMNLAPDSPLVMRSSRHPITEAGFDSLVGGLEADLRLPDRGGLSVAGPEVATSTEASPTVLLGSKPDGETWRVTIDPGTRLPSVVECTNPGGELQERYVFSDVRANPADLANPAAFDPEARWGPPRGLFGLGRAGKPDASTPR